MESKKEYVIYNIEYDSYYYNELNNTSWIEDIQYSQTLPTIADVFYICACLYEKDFFDLSDIIVAEIEVVLTPLGADTFVPTDKIPNHKNPIWIGDVDKLLALWKEVEPELKPTLIKKLFSGAQKVHRVTSSWYARGL